MRQRRTSARWSLPAALGVWLAAACVCPMPGCAPPAAGDDDTGPSDDAADDCVADDTVPDDDTTSAPAGPDGVGPAGGPPPDLARAPGSRTGVNFWRFTLMRDASTGDFEADRRRHGTAAQLLRDADQLGVGLMRHFEDADIYLSSTWRSRADWDSLDSGGNAWSMADGDGFACVPAPWDDTAGGVTIGGDDWNAGDTCVSTAPAPDPEACSFATDAPALSTRAFEALASANGPGRLLVPVVFDRVTRNNNAAEAPDSFWWDFLDQTTAASAFRRGRFWMGTVDEWAAGERAVEDAQAEQYVRQLFAPERLWGIGNEVPFLQLGNEMAREDDVRAREVAWLVLRLSELVEQCTTGSGRRRVLRVLPALASPNNHDPDTHLAVTGLYIQRVEQSLDMQFFHLVRAALVAQEVSGDPSRFTGVLGEGMGGGAADATAALGLSSAGELDYTAHAEGLRTWSIARGLQAPFHALSYHWFNALGAPGMFLYLSALPAMLDTMHTRAGAWFAGGAELPIWCTETGVSSAKTPRHFYDHGVVVDGGSCYGHLGYAPGTDPGSAETDASGCAGVDGSEFEYRLDPLTLARFWGGLEEQEGGFGFTCGIQWNAAALEEPAGYWTPPGDTTSGWPEGALVNDDEQAAQVWSRMAYMLGLGVEKVLWHTNEGVATSSDGDDIRQYGYGVTEDTAVVSSWDGTTCALDEADVPYERRAKKPSYCALARWGRYLGHVANGRVLPFFEGGEGLGPANKGFYAVAFRRSPEDEDQDELPFALVAWTDAQAWDPCLDAGLRPSDCSDVRHLVFVPDEDPNLAGIPAPRQVSTVPTDWTVLPEGSRVVSACLDAGHEPEPVDDADDPAYGGPAVWRFDADQTLPYYVAPGGAWSPPYASYVDIQVNVPPQLVLLPAGKLRWIEQMDPFTSQVLIDLEEEL